MRLRRTLALLPALGLIAALAPFQAVQPVNAVVGGTLVDLGQWLSPPTSLSTSGDYATDTFSDPWDFENQEDIIPIPEVGTFRADAASISNGVFTAASHDYTEIRLLMNWMIRPNPASPPYPVLPWGRDGWAHPIDAARYTQADFRIRSDLPMSNNEMLIRWYSASGATGAIPFSLPDTGWHTLHFDLTNRSLYPFPGSDAVWSGPIVRFELFRGGLAGNPSVNIQLDWFRLHSADSSRTPPAGLPSPQVLTPNEQGGADYATVERGNPWDFAGMDDVGESYGVANLAINGGNLTGTTINNDPSIGLPLGPTLNTDRYHRLTADVCYGGGFSLANSAGGGMVGRVVWMPHNTNAWTETQDFVVFPGCQKITLDLVTSPPGALNDESTNLVTGWRGVRIDQLRFDLDEDPGHRDFTVQNVTLADDAAFSTNYPITFRDAVGSAGAKADIYVTTSKGSYAGTKIAGNISVAGGVNTFNWNGLDANGAAMPNATYWVYVVMKNAAGSGVGYSTGPVRMEKPVPSAPSYYVPLTPARLLDTRTGQGGNISPLSDETLTELTVTGVGGVPQANVTAVVMNVTAATPTGSGYITAWPSGEPRPLVSNINFVPGQTVPNLVTVKVGGNGRVNLFNSAGTTHLIADVAGYYTTVPPAAGGRFTAVTPARLLDTRTGAGGSVGPLGENQQLNLGVTGVGGVPSSGVTAVALNVTVDQPTGTGFLTVWPAGEARPNASTHNYVPTLTVANLVLAKVGANGQVSIYNSAGDTHVVADVIGYFSTSGGLFVPVNPQRLVDTRNGTGGMVPMGSGETQTMAMTNSNPVPPNATAVVVNVTSVNSTTPGYVTVWPTASGRPVASTLNPRPGVAVPNQAYLRVGTGGGLDAFNANGSTDLIVDVFGYVVGG